jgi:type I restriction enzyme S subunit
VANLGKLSFKGSQPVISGTKIYSQTAPLPPLPEQSAIVSKLQALMQKLDEAEKQIEKSLNTSQMLAKTILAEAFKVEMVLIMAPLHLKINNNFNLMVAN